MSKDKESMDESERIKNLRMAYAKTNKELNKPHSGPEIEKILMELGQMGSVYTRNLIQGR